MVPRSLPVPVAIVLAIGLLAGIAGSQGGFRGDYGLAAAMFAGAIAVTTRAVTRREERLAWSLLAAGLWIYAAGQVLFITWIATMDQPPFPSLADWMWLALPVSGLFAMLALARARGIVASVSAVLDGFIVASTISGVLAALIYEPVYKELVREGVGFGMVLPLAEIVVVSAVVVGAAARRWRLEPSGVLIIGAFLLLAFGDCVYSMAAASTGWSAGTWIDFPYVAAMILLGLAPWMPLRNAPPADVNDTRSLTIPLVAGFVAIPLVAYGVIADLNPVAKGETILLTVGVVGRMAFALRGWSMLLAKTQREADTDQLTGLGNRRALLGDLPEDGAEATLMLFDLDGFKAYNDTHGHNAGDELLVAFARRLEEALGGEARAYRMGGDEFCVLLPADRRDLRIQAATALSGENGGFHVTSSWGEVEMPGEASCVADALRIADRRMYAMKNGRPNAAGTQLREALNRVVKIREPDLHDHVIDVGRMAAEVAQRLGLPEHEWSDIVHGAELHDVGKLAIPESILNKPGPLDEREWAIMRRHTILGEQLLSGIPALVNAARLVRASHESWDGSGYPDAIAGEAIPLGARIIAACDAYDAMVTDRPYRNAMSQDDAVAELRRCSGTQFDPRVVKALIAALEARERPVSPPEPVAV